MISKNCFIHEIWLQTCRVFFFIFISLLSIFQERIHLLESVKMLSNNLTKLREEYKKTRQQVLHNVSTAQENSVNRMQIVF